MISTSDPITTITARAFKIPTDDPEADGTLAWNSTTIVIATVQAGGKTGLGYSYASRACATLINDLLGDVLKGRNARDIPALWQAMQVQSRNLGVAGQVASAIAALDTALWDLKARLLDTSLLDLMGATRDAVPVYGSGGFTTYSEKHIRHQIEDWQKSGITMVKIKIGEYPDQDLARVKAARKALGDDGTLMVDANGAYTAKQALAFADKFGEYNIKWFEEPVSSDDLDGLHRVRDRAPLGMEITAGEYIYEMFSLKRMLDAKAVDVLQLDATRCQGYTGFIRGAAQAQAAQIQVSSHCAPAIHLPVCCHIENIRPMEYFHDHVRIERMLFDGVPDVKDGLMTPYRDRPGNGLTFREADAKPFEI